MPIPPAHRWSRRESIGLLAAGLTAFGNRGVQAQEIARKPLAGGSLRVLTDGAIPLPVSALARDVSPEAVRAALISAGLSADAAESALNVPLLTDGTKLTLFDCGAGRNFLPTTGKFAASAEAAGIDPAAVGNVLFTHAHPDHLWGALDDFDTPAYPNATYHIAAAEWDFWFSPDILSRLPEDRHAFAAGAQRVLKILEPQVKRFKPGEEVVSGIAAIDTQGHTPGHVSFDVTLGGDRIIIGGDALTHPVLSFAHPEWSTGFDHEPERAVATRLRLLDLLAQSQVPISTYHLPRGGIGRVERKGSVYQFVAA
jgi:glyoxylase-like metal-dependent hydrolase (beta-lactamase superfamily II)